MLRDIIDDQNLPKTNAKIKIVSETVVVLVENFKLLIRSRFQEFDEPF